MPGILLGQGHRLLSIFSPYIRFPFGLLVFPQKCLTNLTDLDIDTLDLVLQLRRAFFRGKM